MKEEIQLIYIRAAEIAQNNSQTVGEKNDYYITLQQLEKIISDIFIPNL